MQISRSMHVVLTEGEGERIWSKSKREREGTWFGAAQRRWSSANKTKSD